MPVPSPDEKGGGELKVCIFTSFKDYFSFKLSNIEKNNFQDPDHKKFGCEITLVW